MRYPPWSTLQHKSETLSKKDISTAPSWGSLGARRRKRNSFPNNYQGPGFPSRRRRVGASRSLGAEPPWLGGIRDNSPRNNRQFLTPPSRLPRRRFAEGCCGSSQDSWVGDIAESTYGFSGVDDTMQSTAIRCSHGQGRDSVKGGCGTRGVTE